MTFKVLNVGAGFAPNPSFADIEGEPVFTRLDGFAEGNPDVVHDIRDPLPDDLVEQFDVVYISHVLEHIEYRQAAWVLKNVCSAIAPGGLLAVIVPDMEWACRKILRREYDLGVMGVINGGQITEFDYHKCGFTAPMLKLIIESVGLEVIQVSKQEFECIIDGKHFFPDELRATGRKP